MRDIKRIPSVCKKLEEAWKNVPDQRLGQFLLNYVFDEYRDVDGLPDSTAMNVFNQEDDLTEKRITNMTDGPPDWWHDNVKPKPKHRTYR